jgi:hypothetical protein
MTTLYVRDQSGFREAQATDVLDRAQGDFKILLGPFLPAGTYEEVEQVTCRLVWVSQLPIKVGAPRLHP